MLTLLLLWGKSRCSYFLPLFHIKFIYNLCRNLHTFCLWVWGVFCFDVVFTILVWKSRDVNALVQFRFGQYWDLFVVYLYVKRITQKDENNVCQFDIAQIVMLQDVAPSDIHLIYQHYCCLKTIHGLSCACCCWNTSLSLSLITFSCLRDLNELNAWSILRHSMLCILNTPSVRRRCQRKDWIEWGYRTVIEENYKQICWNKYNILLSYTVTWSNNSKTE